MSDSVLYAVADGVATITLNRPHVMNALDGEMIRRLRSACAEVERNAGVRAAVIRGAGPAFLAGGDVSVFRANLARMAELVREFAGELHEAILALRRAPKPVLASVHGPVAGAGVSLLAELVREFAGELHEAILALRRAPKPVLASVHGPVAGAGVSLVAAADLAVAASDATFTLAYGRIGASPDGGATHFLPRLLGQRKALELMLLSDAIDAATALEIGLVNRVVGREALDAETERIVRHLARGATRAFAETKQLVNGSFERPLGEQLEAEVEAFARCAGTRDFAEGVSAFVEKRKPRFEGN